MLASRAGWLVDMCAHCEDSDLAMIPQLPSSHQGLTDVHDSGNCCILGHWKSALSTLCICLSLTGLVAVSLVKIEKGYLWQWWMFSVWVQVIFLCWCLVIDTQLEGIGSHQSTICGRCLSNLPPCRIACPGEIKCNLCLPYCFLWLHLLILALVRDPYYLSTTKKNWVLLIIALY